MERERRRTDPNNPLGPFLRLLIAGGTASYDELYLAAGGTMEKRGEFFKYLLFDGYVSVRSNGTYRLTDRGRRQAKEA